MSDTFKKSGILVLFILFPVFFTSLVVFHFRYEIRGMLLSDYIEYLEVEGEVVESVKGIDPWGKRQTSEAEITYVYKVRESYYASHVVNYAYDMSNYEYYLNKYPVGKKVVVYYERYDPEYSVLEPNTKNYMLLFWPIFVLTIALVPFFGERFCRKYRWCGRLFD